MKYINFLFAVLLTSTIYAQYTKVINSKRPGFSESPFGVGTRVTQIETGVFYQYNNKAEIFTNRESMGMDLFLRRSFFWEKLEVNANFRYQSDKILNNMVLGTTNSQSGISQFTVGAKYLFYMPKYKDPAKEIRSWKRKYTFDKKRLIPSVGLYVGLNTNFLGTDYKAPSLSPKATILLQNDFSDYLIWVNNIVGDYLTIPDQRTYGYISTLSYSMTDRFAIFGETQGMFTRYTKQYHFGGGFAYLPSRDLQIDIFARHEIEFEHVNLYSGLGLSWRLDRHKDKVFYKKGKGESLEKKEGNFFSRVFKNKGKRRSKAPRVKKTRTKRSRSKKAETKEHKPRKKRERRERKPRRKRRNKVD